MKTIDVYYQLNVGDYDGEYHIEVDVPKDAGDKTIKQIVRHEIFNSVVGNYYSI